MLKNVVKTTARVLCMMMLFSQTAYLAPLEGYSSTERRRSLFDPDVPEVSTVAKKNVYIPQGTTLDVTLKSEISSKKSKVGEVIDFEVAENLIVNDVVVIAKGTVGKAVITESRKAAGLGRKGKLALQAVSTHTKNGIEVPLTSDLSGTGKSDGGSVVVFAAVSIVGGLFMKGTNITYPAGTHFTVAVKNDTDLGVTDEDLAQAMERNQPVGKRINIVR